MTLRGSSSRAESPYDRRVHHQHRRAPTLFLILGAIPQFMARRMRPGPPEIPERARHKWGVPPGGGRKAMKPAHQLALRVPGWLDMPDS